MTPARDRQDILEVINRYFYAVDRRDFDLLGTCFAEDVVFASVAQPPVTMKSRETVVATLKITTNTFLASTHALGNAVVTVDGDTATASTHAIAYVLQAGETGPPVVAVRGLRYDDELTRTAQGWAIHRRTHQATWQFNADSSPPYLKLGQPAAD